MLQTSPYQSRDQWSGACTFRERWSSFVLPWQGNGSFEKASPRFLRQGVARLPQTPYGPPSQADHAPYLFRWTQGAVWSAAACCRFQPAPWFRQGSLLPSSQHWQRWRFTIAPLNFGASKLADGKLPRRKAAASCRTPKVAVLTPCVLLPDLWVKISFSRGTKLQTLRPR